MTAFYDNLQLTAQTLLADKGQACTLTVVTPGTYDPATSTSTPTTTNYSVTAAVFDYPVAMIDGSRILRGDKKVLMSAYGLTAVPKPDHTFTDAASVVYTVIDAKATAPGGTVVLWTLQVRR